LQRLQLGLNHEQQHQELLLTDIKYNFSVNPLLPAYLKDAAGEERDTAGASAKMRWCEYTGGISSLGVSVVDNGEREHRDAHGSEHDVSLAAGSADTFGQIDDVVLVDDLVHVDEVIQPAVMQSENPQLINMQLNSRNAATDSASFSFDHFYFDNETPRHRVLLQPYALADRLVNNGEFLKFIEDGGYQRSEFWLSDGWTRVQQEGWLAPLYWYAPGQTMQAGQKNREHRWQEFTLYGLKPLRLSEPVCHISYYEADAFARWAGARLPTEAEWENAASQLKFEGHFIDDGVLHPRAPCTELSTPCQLFGDVWEWTASSYAPYPGYQAGSGAIGEYNGKFMCSQMVLRGGSCVSEREHLRASYRNFFYPWDRWQFSGLRLARAQ
jgi:ergothioneine biosynthesis protein EgtB